MQGGNNLDEIRKLKKNLKEIKVEFSKFKPQTDWNKYRVKRLIENIELTEKVVGNELLGQFINLDLDYFKKNIKGLRTVLQSERKFFLNSRRRGKK